MTISGLDSATPPTPGEAQCAKAAGYGAWVGYLAPSAGWHSAIWTNTAFGAVRQAGLQTAGVIFGPDAALAVSEAKAAGLSMVIIDVEANDTGHYAPAWGDAVRAAGLRAGCYGLRRTIGAFAPHFDVLWFAAEQWDGQPSHGAQHGYNTTVCGVAVDTNTFGSAFFAAPAPPPHPTPTPIPTPQEEDMYVIQSGPRISLVAGLFRRGLGQPEADAYIRLLKQVQPNLVQPTQVTDADYNAFTVAPGETG